MLKTLSVFPLVGTTDCSNNGLVYRKYKENDCGGIMKVVLGTSKEVLDWALEQDSKTLENTLIIEQRILWGENYWYARPFSEPLNMHRCFGGNYVTTSDSRFKDFTGLGRGVPIPVHDRYETWEEYEALSR